MSSPLLELRALIAKKSQTQTVTVIQSTPEVVTVNSRGGTTTLQNNGSIYAKGDVLIVRDSTILGKTTREESIPVYFV